MRYLVLIISILFCVNQVFAQYILETRVTRNDYVQSRLQRFMNQPQAEMDAPILKRSTSSGAWLLTPNSAFTADEIISSEFVPKKYQWRRQLLATAANQTFSEILPEDRPENLVDNDVKLLVRLEDIEASKLTSAELKNSPWADDYWAINQGVIAARFADRKFNTIPRNWRKLRDYALIERPMSKMILEGADVADQISPAEKYDLLVGSDATLTKAMWNEGAEYADTAGKVEGWMGICHGWAPASYMLPRPVHSVTLPAADGRSYVRFYADEVKALGSLLWSRAQVKTNFIGGRCNSKEPKKDNNGRVIEQNCFDNNPGSWHITVVNQLGQAKRSFVMDATYDYEVWNQPVLGYSYTYFNPQSGKTVTSLDEAKVLAADFSNDKFKSYRSKKAAAYVGVAMDVSYVVEHSPLQVENSSEMLDDHVTVTYMYDLELNDRGEIIGGEWYSNKHPDFVWTPAHDAVAMSDGDYYLRGAWDGKSVLSADWRKVGEANSRLGQVLGKVVYKIFEMSSK